MNAVRVGYWFGGLCLVLVAGLALDGMGLRTPVPLVMFLAWGILGLTGEVALFLRSLVILPARQPPAGTRPADGAVGVARVLGVVGDPNGIDPRYLRFVGEDPAWPEPPPRKPGSRSVPPLLGRIVWVSLFQSRDGKDWSDEEIARAHDALRRAGVWIEGEARRWDAPVNIDLSDTYFVAHDHERDEVEIAFRPEGDAQGPFEARAEMKALIGMSRAAAQLGFRDAADLIARINARLGADVAVSVWLLHPRRAGRSFAVPLDHTELAGVSLAVCYSRESDFPEPLRRPPVTDPVTIAHEMLHLFGAEDKYGVSLESFPLRSVTPRDIMRLHHSRLAQLRVDPRTAAEIGWNLPSKEHRTFPWV